MTLRKYNVLPLRLSSKMFCLIPRLAKLWYWLNCWNKEVILLNCQLYLSIHPKRVCPMQHIWLVCCYFKAIPGCAWGLLLAQNSEIYYCAARDHISRLPFIFVLISWIWCPLCRFFFLCFFISGVIKLNISLICRYWGVLYSSKSTIQFYNIFKLMLYIVLVI